MTKVHVVYGSRHGATRGIALRIGEILEAEGLQTEVIASVHQMEPGDANAFVIGSGVYMGSWLREPVDFLERNVMVLAHRPVWLFSSGPLPAATSFKPSDDLIEATLGPSQGPGSGGRRKIEELSALIHPLDHRIFFGAFDPKDPPRAVSERLIRMMPASKGLLPPGDYREWDEIEAWARTIATALMASPIPA